LVPMSLLSDECWRQYGEGKLAVRVRIVREDCDQRRKVVELKYPRSRWIDLSI